MNKVNPFRTVQIIKDSEVSMAASTVLRSARQILKFLSEGQGYERVMKGVRYVTAILIVSDMII